MLKFYGPEVQEVEKEREGEEERKQQKKDSINEGKTCNAGVIANER